MVTVNCPYCEGNITLENPFSKFLEDIVCPHCENISGLNYEEDSGEEDTGYFYLEKW